MNKLSNRGFNNGSKRVNKIKNKNASNLTYKDFNTVNFSEEEINKLVEQYGFKCSIISTDTLQIINSRAHTTWFCVNHENKFLELRHKNAGDENIHSHFQSNHYQLNHVFESIKNHDGYVSFNLDYRNTDMGKLFGMIEGSQNNKSKYIKIS